MCKELENGRLVRLMAKLGFINERPEYGGPFGVSGGRNAERCGQSSQRRKTQ